MKKSEKSIRDLHDAIKQNIIYFMGIQEGEEQQNGTESLSEDIMPKDLQPEEGNEDSISKANGLQQGLTQGGLKSTFIKQE